MRKSILIFLAIVVFLFSLFFFYYNRTIKVCENKDLRKIYKLNDYENVNIYFSNVLGEKIGSFESKEDIIKLLNIIKDQKIKPVLNNDNINRVSSYRFIIKDNTSQNEFRVVISSNVLTINSKTYLTENNIEELVEDIFKNYKDIKL